MRIIGYTYKKKKEEEEEEERKKERKQKEASFKSYNVSERKINVCMLFYAFACSIHTYAPGKRESAPRATRGVSRLLLAIGTRDRIY